nr:MAG TPA: hypothetical protein [Caudoviricetes sp.]
MKCQNLLRKDITSNLRSENKLIKREQKVRKR